jgi:transposase
VVAPVNVESEKNMFEKNYQNKEWLAKELETKSARQISKEIGVSYKLINAWGLRFGLLRRTPDFQLP